MYNVLIVDDEELIRDGFAQLIDWEENGLNVVGCVSNGLEAMQLANGCPVDIVITDIKMPEMDGLELIRALREKSQGTHYIVISGYQDFDYVKRAAVLGIENYILKPVDDKELLNTLMNTSDKLDQEKSQIQVNWESPDILKNNILYRWVANSIDEFELKERAAFLNMDIASPHYIIGVLREKDAKMNCGKILNAIHKIRIQHQPARSTVLPFVDLEGNIILIFLAKAPEDEANIIRPFLQQLHQWLQENQQSGVFITVSSVGKGIRNVPDLYKQAMMLHEKVSLFNHQKIIFYQDSKPQLSGQAEKNNDNLIVSRLKSYIERNYSSDINMKTISNEFNMNAFYLGQVFKDVTGDTFNHYLNTFRIEKAKSLLANGLAKATEVAEKVGYSNTNYFYTLFRKTVGVSPTQYKSQK